MAVIRPISDLRNRAREISEICHKTGQPVFISKNGKGDLVVLSHERYEQIDALLEVYAKLDEAEADERQGDRGITHAQMMKALKARIG